MIYKIKGQVDHVYDAEPYNKKGDRLKRTILITQSNSLAPNRIEYIPFDFMDDDINLISTLCIASGDIVEIEFELRGRKFVKQDEPDKPLVYSNNQAINIKLL
jgi:hypothetical protein